MEELKKLCEELNMAFAEYRKTNDERLKQLSDRGSNDSLLDEKLEKMDKAMSDIEKQISEINARNNRLPLYGPDGKEAKRLSPDEEAHTKAFLTWARKGQGENELTELQRKQMQTNVDEDGGFLLPNATVGRIVQRIYETSPIRMYANVETITTKAYEFPLDLNEASAGWVGETGKRSTTDTPKVGMGKIEAHELYAQPQTTQRMLDDAAQDIEAWLARKAADKFSRLENTAFMVGDGVEKPKGLFAYPTATTGDATRAWGTFQHIATGAAGAFPATDPGDKLIDLVYSLKEAYRASAQFVMSRLTVAAVRKIKDEENYLWSPGLGGQPATLLGFPIVEMEDVPGIAANSLSIAFGNIRETYTIVDRIGIRTLRDPYTNKPFVQFYMTKMTGGDVVNFESLRFLKFA